MITTRTSAIAGVFIGLLSTMSGCATSTMTPRVGDPGTVSFKIDGMACPNCAKHIEHELAEVPGVRAASVDFSAATAVVLLDDRQPANMDQLNAAVDAWKREHFAAEEDPDCLNPERRKEIKQQGATGTF